ncbi:type II secretion system F family protein [Nocardioides piscis]|uniref:VWA domain-containing protein n=1 Tax=Nocardioides piscis TaxID=2714938 RepID=A0A6G7YJF7_9ACTN|nr:type II secretion system F family protein [Nocardioides piscis]QIK76883.1 VWA domain-containing protein [Nocardioides piscis]
MESDNGKISMVVSVDGVPGAAVDPSQVSVQIDGADVEAAVSTVAAGKVSRSTILVVDASNSMRGAKFDAAAQAVTAFVNAAPADVEIGMVPFAGEVGTSIPPTTDRAALLTAFGSLSLNKGTNVYDAVAEAVALVGTDGSRSLLLLSDGADTGSLATLDEVATAAAESEVVVDVVSLATAEKATALATLAKDTNGAVIPADPEALGQVFADQADALARQLLVRLDLPEGVSGDADIAVSVTADGATYADTAFVNVGEGTQVAQGPKVEVVQPPLVDGTIMLAGAGALFLGAATLLWFMLTGATGRQASASKRLEGYFAGGEGDSGGHKVSDSAAFKDGAVALSGKVVGQDLEAKISRRLEGAGSALAAAEWVLLHAAIAIGTAAICFLLLGPGIAVLGLILGIVLPWVYLKWRHKRRLAAFNSQLAETLGLMAGGLQAGLSLPQAVDTVVREGIEPMAGELRRALVEQRLGIDITDALEGIGSRMESDDFGWVVMAIRIQREVGGNLAEILHTVADTLREREYLRRQVKALSAEGRLSGYLLTALPVFITVFLYFANRAYIEVLWSTFVGWIILGVAASMLGMGGWAMAKLAKVEV